MVRTHKGGSNRFRMVAFQIGADDAELFERQFSSHVTADNLMNILKYHTYSRLLIDGMPSRPFSFRTKLIDELKKGRRRTFFVTAAVNLSNTSHSDPVWPMLLMLLIAFMSFELILSGMISRERFGTATIDETSEKFGEGGFGVPLEFGQKTAAADTGQSRKVGSREAVL